MKPLVCKNLTQIRPCNKKMILNTIMRKMAPRERIKRNLPVKVSTSTWLKGPNETSYKLMIENLTEIRSLQTVTLHIMH